MPTLRDVAELAAGNGHLAVVGTARADGTVQASLVNAGVSTHPTSGEPIVAFVTAGRVKLANLRARPRVTLTFHQGGRWITVEGSAELAGPDDTGLGLPPDRIRLLLREIFTDAGGTHDDWSTYDRVMAEERRAAVLVTPTRVYSN